MVLFYPPAPGIALYQQAGLCRFQVSRLALEVIESISMIKQMLIIRRKNFERRTG